jgi:hypothetical protein
MKLKAFSLAAAVALAASGTADADPITYDFIGTVTAAGGELSVPLGSTVTGTYTFNLINATEYSGTTGSTSENWGLGGLGGSSQGTAPLTLSQYVFTSTAQVAGYSYSTIAGGAIQDGSSVAGEVPTEADPYYEYWPSEANFPSGVTQSGSSFTLIGSTAAPWSATGLPIFDSATSAQGNLYEFLSDGTEDTISYDITSLYPAGSPPVPIPAAAWLLLSGLAGVATFARRKWLPENVAS